MSTETRHFIGPLLDTVAAMFQGMGVPGLPSTKLKL
jgi:hypothetical protein